jgi:hypothetical protein
MVVPHFEGASPMANYPKFDLSNVIGNAYDTAVELYHTWSGDKAKADSLWMLYHSELFRALRDATPVDTYLLDDDTRKGIVKKWARNSSMEILKSAHPEWVVMRVYNLIQDETGL